MHNIGANTPPSLPTKLDRQVIYLVCYRTDHMPIDAVDVACWFVKYSGFTKTHLQVQKMSYIAHGHMLAIYDEPLFQDVVEAWDRGPVMPSVWHEFKKWGTDLIGRIPRDRRYTVSPFNDKQSRMLEKIFASYGKFCGYYMSQITHKDGNLETPWSLCYRRGQNVRIDDGTTKQYYKQFLSI